MWIVDRRRRLLCSVDLSRYGRRDDRAQAAAQAQLLALLDRAGEEAGLRREIWMRQETGDGELAILPDEEPEVQLVDVYVRRLAVALAGHNLECAEPNRLRARIAVHFGIAYRADLGYAGQGVVEVSRLVDSNPLRQVLERAVGTNLVLALSQRVYDDTVAQRATTLPPEQFRKVRVEAKEYSADAWLYAPGVDIHSIDLGSASEVAESEAPPARRPDADSWGGSSVNITADSVKTGDIAGRDINGR